MWEDVRLMILVAAGVSAMRALVNRFDVAAPDESLGGEIARELRRRGFDDPGDMGHDAMAAISTEARERGNYLSPTSVPVAMALSELGLGAPITDEWPELGESVIIDNRHGWGSGIEYLVVLAPDVSHKNIGGRVRYDAEKGLIAIVPRSGGRPDRSELELGTLPIDFGDLSLLREELISDPVQQLAQDFIDSRGSGTWGSADVFEVLVEAVESAIEFHHEEARWRTAEETRQALVEEPDMWTEAPTVADLHDWMMTEFQDGRLHDPRLVGTIALELYRGHSRTPVAS
jgi:hypothetical protein